MQDFSESDDDGLRSASGYGAALFLSLDKKLMALLKSYIQKLSDY